MVVAGDGVAPDEAGRWDEYACTLGALGTVKPGQVWGLLSGS
jgi:hypothetical protein